MLVVERLRPPANCGRQRSTPRTFEPSNSYAANRSDHPGYELVALVLLPAEGPGATACGSQAVGDREVLRGR